MTRTAAQFVSLFLLAACATHSSPPPAEPPAPKAPDVRLCADVPAEPALPPGASIPQPVGPSEQQATEAFLNWVGASLDWGRSLAERAEVARKACLH